jgi:hypothetical protein
VNEFMIHQAPQDSKPGAESYTPGWDGWADYYQRMDREAAQDQGYYRKGDYY